MSLKTMPDTFWGYVREDGSVGIRNYVLIIPAVVCATEVAFKIKRKFKDVAALDNQYGCAQIEKDVQQTSKTLSGLAKNPNVAGILVIGLGCETLENQPLIDEIAKSKKPVEAFTIQETGGTSKSVKKGAEICRRMVADAAKITRTEVPLSALTLGAECGGSDAFSGLSGNPAIGAAADLLVSKGGRVIMSETPEMIGAEHLLAARAVNASVSKQVIDMVERCEKMALDLGIDIRSANPSPGNKRGGITTLEEKSLGCAYKGGTTTVQEVVEYAQIPSKQGLVLMDTPGFDAQSLIGMAAGGMQVSIFSTGRGSPMGCPIVPVIKIATNTPLYERMKENMDINAGVILDGKSSLQKVGQRLFKLMCDVANGKRTAAEKLGHNEFGITRIGPTF